MPSTWQIQPASDPSVPPADDRWGKIDASNGDWRWSPLVGEKPSWANVKRDTVNSLWYQQAFALPADWSDRKIVADFRRIQGDAIVYVNGKRVQELLRPGGEIDLTPLAHPNEPNTLQVFVTRDYTGISRGFKQDPLRFTARGGDNPLHTSQWGLGLTGPVTLIGRPRPAAISDVYVKPSWRTKSLSLDVETDASTDTADLAAVADIIDSAGKTVLTVRGKPFTTAAGISTRTITAAWANPIPWELDGPYLYTARVRLIHGGAVVAQYPDVSFGFREVWTSGRQIIMNGHASRWRLSSLAEGADTCEGGLQFFRLLGYNVMLDQNNPSAWWRDWAETPKLDDAILDKMDRMGMGLSAAAPSVNWLRNGILRDPQARADYEREMALYLRRYRNHPCIVAWTVGMNAYNPMTAIWPQGMGRRETSPQPIAKALECAGAIARKIAPVQLAYSHADGGELDICTSNTYLNFAPLQEREEWPSLWATTGDMPAQAAEFGQPGTMNFWKGKRSFFTEYMAMYLGDKAYTSEHADALRDVIDAGLSNKDGFGDFWKINLDDYPAYWDFQRLFVRNTNRAWRTWGVNGGWSYWTLDSGYGDPPTWKPGSNVFNRYRNLAAPITAKPSWANPNFDIHSAENQPLLAYIAGDPVATDKTHAFYAGETVKKNIAIVWDGPGSRTLSISCALQGIGAIAPKTLTVTLQPGDIRLVPVTFQMPPVPARTEAKITMTARDSAVVAAKDEFAIEVFPRPTPLKTAARVALFDPRGYTRPILTCLNVDARDWKPGDSLNDIDLLVIGREALTPGLRPLYTPQNIAHGLRAIVMEQKPEIWKGLGFKLTDTMPRYVFPRDIASPIVSGVQPADLINWRGSPDLLPEGISLSHDVTHAPKWTNRHAVASVALQIPEVAGFTPILSCEFDNNYTPLLQCRYGAGEVTFCSLDLTHRVGIDPAASLIARNLIAYETRAPQKSRVIASVGDMGSLATDLKLPISTETNWTNAGIVLVGSGLDEPAETKLSEFVRAGGTAVCLPSTTPVLTRRQYALAPISLYQAVPDASPIMDAIGPGLLRWRDHLDVDGFAASGQPEGSTVHAGGLVLTRREGKGQWIFCQAQPALLATRYAADADRAMAIQTSVQRLYQLTSQVLTNAGVDASQAVMTRLTHLDLGPAYEILGQWQELGPFPVEHDDGDAMLAKAFPGEESAIAGDTNPNINYTRSDGVQLNWRQTVKADAAGHVDLSGQLGPSGLAVAYLVKTIHSDSKRTATLRLGVDFRIQVWVNGVLAFRTANGRARPSAFHVNIPLNAGNNIITIKVGSGSKGFGIWSDLSSETPPSDGSADDSPVAELYHPLTPDFDPYEFHYW